MTKFTEEEQEVLQGVCLVFLLVGVMAGVIIGVAGTLVIMKP